MFAISLRTPRCTWSDDLSKPKHFVAQTEIPPPLSWCCTALYRGAQSLHLLNTQPLSEIQSKAPYRPRRLSQISPHSVGCMVNALTVPALTLSPPASGPGARRLPTNQFFVVCYSLLVGSPQVKRNGGACEHLHLSHPTSAAASRRRAGSPVEGSRRCLLCYQVPEQSPAHPSARERDVRHQLGLGAEAADAMRGSD